MRKYETVLTLSTTGGTENEISIDVYYNYEPPTPEHYGPEGLEEPASGGVVEIRNVFYSFLEGDSLLHLLNDAQLEALASDILEEIEAEEAE